MHLRHVVNSVSSLPFEPGAGQIGLKIKVGLRLNANETLKVRPWEGAAAHVCKIRNYCLMQENLCARCESRTRTMAGIMIYH